MKIINDFSNSDGLVLTSPIRFANFVNLNFFYGPYGWKDEDGNINRYFTKKNGPRTTRYPNESVLNIRPSGLTEADCFVTEDEQLFYKTSEVYGYALGCLYLQSVSASAGTTFGVVNDNDSVIEYIYDGVINGNPCAHVKVDTKEIIEETKSAIQEVVPVVVDEHGDPVHDLNTYIDDQLLAYAKTSELYDGGNTIKLDRIPQTVVRNAELSKYAQTSELSKYAETNDLFEDGKIKLTKIPRLTESNMPSGYTKTSEIAGYVSSAIKADDTIRTAAAGAVQTALQDNERMTGIVEGVVSGKYLSKNDYADDEGKLKIERIPSAFAKTADLEKFAQTSELSKYAQINELFEDGKIKLAKIPTLTDSVMPYGYVKTSDISGLAKSDLSNINTNEFNTKVREVQGIVKSSELNSYAKTVDLFEGNKIKLDKIPQLNDAKMPSGYVKTDDLDSYALSSDLNAYAKTAQLEDYAKTVQLENFAPKADLENYAKTSTLSDYAKADFSNVPEFGTKVLAVQGVAKTSQLQELAPKSELNKYAVSTELLKYAETNDLFEGGRIKLAKIPTLDDSVMPSGYTKTSEIAGYVSSAIKADDTIRIAAAGAVQTALQDNERMSGIIDGVVSGKYLSKNDYTDEQGKLSLSKIPQITDDIMPSGYVKTTKLNEYARTTDLFDSNSQIKLEKIPSLTDAKMPIGYVKTDKLNDYAKTSALLDYTPKTELDKYAKTSSLSDYAPKSDLNKYVQTSELFKDNLIDIDKLPTLTESKIPMTVVRNSQLEAYTKTSELAAKVLNIDALAKTSNLEAYTKTAELSSKVLAINGLAKTSDIMTSDGIFKVGKIPTEIARTSALSAYQTTAELTSKVLNIEGLAKTSQLNAYAKTHDLLDTDGVLKLTKIPTLNDEKIPSSIVRTNTLNLYAKTSEIGGYVSSAIKADDTIRTAAAGAVQTALQDNERMTGIVEGVVSSRYLSKSDYANDNGTLKLAKLPQLTEDKIPNTFVKTSALVDFQPKAEMGAYVLTSKIMKDANTLNIDAFPDVTGKVNNLDMSKVSGLSTKFDKYIQSTDILDVTGVIKTANIPTLGMSKIDGLSNEFNKYQSTAGMSVYVQSSNILASNGKIDASKLTSLAANQIPELSMEKISGLSTKFDKYVETSSILTANGNINVNKLPDVTAKVENLNMSKISGLTDKFTEYQTTADMAAKLAPYALTSKIMSDSNTIKLAVLPNNLEEKITNLDMSKVSGLTSKFDKYIQSADILDTTGVIKTSNIPTLGMSKIDGLSTEFGKYQPTSGMSAYVQSSKIMKDANTLNIEAFPDVTGKVNNLDMSKVSGLSTKFDKYIQSADILDISGVIKTASIPTLGMSKIDGLSTEFGKYQPTSGMGAYVQSANILSSDGKLDASKLTSLAANQIPELSMEKISGLSTKFDRYVETANILTANGNINVNKLPDVTSKVENLNMSKISGLTDKFTEYQTTAGMDAKLAPYALTSRIMSSDGKLDATKLSSLSASQIPTLEMSKVNGLTTKFDKYVESSNILTANGNINIDKLPDVTNKVTLNNIAGINKFVQSSDILDNSGIIKTSSIPTIGMSKIDGLSNEFNKYQSTAGMSAYVQSSKIMSDANTLKLDSIPTTIARASALTAYAKTSEIGGYVSSAIKADDTIRTAAAGAVQTALQDNERMTGIVEGVVSSRYLSKADYVDNEGTLKLTKFPELTEEKIPSTIVRSNALLDYQPKSEMGVYVQSANILSSDGKLDASKLTSLAANQIPELSMEKISGLNTKFDKYQTTAGMADKLAPYAKTSSLSAYQTTEGMAAKLAPYALTSKIMSDANTLKIDAIPDVTTKVNNLDMSKVSGLDNKFNQYQTTEGMAAKLAPYALTSKIMSDANTLKIDAIPDVTSKVNNLSMEKVSGLSGKFNQYVQSSNILDNNGIIKTDNIPTLGMSKISGLSNKFTEYQTTAGMGAYVQSANILTSNGKINIDNIPDVTTKVNGLDMSKVSGLSSKFDKYIQSADILDTTGVIKTANIPTLGMGKIDGLSNEFNKYQSTAGMSAYVQSSKIMSDTNTLKIDAIPDVSSRVNNLDMSKISGLSDKFDKYVQSANILTSNGNININKLPDVTNKVTLENISGIGNYAKVTALSAYQTTADMASKLAPYALTSNIMSGDGKIDATKLSTLSASQIPTIEMNKVNGLNTKFNQYQTTAGMGVYVQSANIMSGDGKIDATKLSSLSASQIPTLEMSKVSGLSTKFDQYQTTSGMNKYVQSSNIMSGDGKIDATKLSSLSASQIPTLEMSKVSGLNTKFNEYQTTAGMGAYQTTEGMATKLAPYALTSKIMSDANTLKIDAIPDVTTKVSNLDMSKVSGLNIKFNQYQTTAGMGAYQTTEGMAAKLAPYALTSRIMSSDGKLDATKLSSLSASQIPTLEMSKVSGLNTKFNEYQTTAGMAAKLAPYALTSRIMSSDGKLDATKLSSLSASQIPTIEMNKVSGLNTKFNEYQTTAGMAAKLAPYALTSKIMSDANTLKIDAIPDVTTKVNNLDMSKVKDLNTKFNQYQTTSGMGAYVQTSNMLNGDGTLNVSNLPDLSSKIVLGNVSGIGNYAKTGDYVRTSSILSSDGTLNVNNLPDLSAKITLSEVSGISDYPTTTKVKNTLKSYAKTGDYVKTSSILSNDGTLNVSNLPDLSSKINLNNVSGIGAYQTTEGMAAKLAPYALTSKIMSDANTLKIDAIPDVTTKVNNLDMSKVSGLDNKFKQYQTTSGMGAYVQSSTIMSNATTLKLNAIPDVTTKVNGLDMSKVSGLDNKFNQYQTTEGMAAKLAPYALTSKIMSDANTLKIDAIPDVTTKVNNLDMSKVKDLNTKFNQYQTTEGMGAYVQSSTIMSNANTLKLAAIPDVTTKVNGLDMSKVSGLNNKFNQYQTTEGMSQYATVSKVDEAIDKVSDGNSYTTATDILYNVENSMEASDGSLEILTNIFSECYIPETAVKSMYANDVSYGYCVLSTVASGAYSSTAILGKTDAQIKSYIKALDNKFVKEEDGVRKYVYLIPHNSLKNSAASYNPVNVDSKTFNVNPTKYWTFNASNYEYIRCTNSSIFDTSIQYYTSDINNFLGSFDCWWVNRAEEGDNSVYKLQFSKHVTTNDYSESGVQYNANAFKGDYFGNTNGSITNNSSHEDTTSGTTIYFNKVMSNNVYVSSGTSDSQLKMYSTTYKVRLVTEFHNNDVVTQLMTGDTTGDGLGDINDTICDIYNTTTRQKVTGNLDLTGNTNYYFVAKDNYNVNKYNSNAKSLVESTIAWYNEKFGEENCIYLFCYQDGPIYDNHTDTTNGYGYFFRGVAYIVDEGKVQPLNWRPVIPYTDTPKTFEYPAIVDLSGSSTTIGLPDGETVEFTPTMSTDDRVRNFLFKEIERTITETTQTLIPGTAEQKLIHFLGKNMDGKAVLDILDFKKIYANYLTNYDVTKADRYSVLNLDKYPIHHLDLYFAAIVTYMIVNKGQGKSDEYTMAFDVCMALSIVRNMENNSKLQNLATNITRSYKSEEFDSYCSEFNLIAEILEIKGNETELVKRIAFGLFKNDGNIHGISLYFIIRVNSDILNGNQPMMLFDTLYYYNKLIKCEVYGNMSELSNCDGIDETLVDRTLRGTDLRYVLPTSPVITVSMSLLKGLTYVPYVPDTYETTTTTRSYNETITRTIGHGFVDNASYTYSVDGTSYMSHINEWFNNNAIVIFLVKNSGVRKVYEYRKWNKYTKTWSDMGVEEYVNYISATGHVPKPSGDNAQAQAERINNRSVYNAALEVVDLRNSVADDVSSVNNNISVLVDQINQLTAVINSMTGVSAANRLKAITATGKSLVVSSENGPVVSGMSSAYQTSPSSITSTSESVNIPTGTTSKDRDDIRYNKSYAMVDMR